MIPELSAPEWLTPEELEADKLIADMRARFPVSHGLRRSSGLRWKVRPRLVIEGWRRGFPLV